MRQYSSALMTLCFKITKRRLVLTGVASTIFRWKGEKHDEMSVSACPSWVVGVHAFHRLTNVVGAVTVQSQTWWISRHTLKDMRTSVENQQDLTHTHTHRRYTKLCRSAGVRVTVMDASPEWPWVLKARGLVKTISHVGLPQLGINHCRVRDNFLH